MRLTQLLFSRDIAVAKVLTQNQLFTDSPGRDRHFACVDELASVSNATSENGIKREIDITIRMLKHGEYEGKEVAFVEMQFSVPDDPLKLDHKHADETERTSGRIDITLTAFGLGDMEAKQK